MSWWLELILLFSKTSISESQSEWMALSNSEIRQGRVPQQGTLQNPAVLPWCFPQVPPLDLKEQGKRSVSRIWTQRGLCEEETGRHWGLDSGTHPSSLWHHEEEAQKLNRSWILQLCSSSSLLSQEGMLGLPIRQTQWKPKLVNVT